MKPGPRNGRLIRGSRLVGGGPRSGSTNYAQFGNLIADYNPVNATASSGRVTLVTEPVNGFNAQPNVAGTGPTLVSSAPAYNNKPVFRYSPTDPAEGSERLVTTTGLGAAIGTSAWTLVVAGHTNNTTGNSYVFMHGTGTQGLFADGNGLANMYGFTTFAATTKVVNVAPCAMSGVFMASGVCRFKKNAEAVETLPAIGAPNMSGAVYIGNYAAPQTQWNWNGDVARMLVYLGDIGDAGMAAVNAALQSEYGL